MNLPYCLITLQMKLAFLTDIYQKFFSLKMSKNQVQSPKSNRDKVREAMEKRGKKMKKTLALT